MKQTLARSLAIQFLAFFTAALLAPDALAVALQPGHLIVADSHNQSLPVGSKILDIDPLTGVQTVISTGGNLVQPIGVCLDAAGNIIVADAGYGFADAQAGTIIRINPITGQQTVVSSGGALWFPIGVATDSQGFLIVTQEGKNQTTPAVLRIDPATGAQTVVATGPPMHVSGDVVVDPAGNYLASDFQSLGGGAILKVDPASGAQSIVSTGNYLALGPAGIWLNNLKSQSLLVVENNAFSGPAPSALLDINTATGSQSIVSSGGFLLSPTDVAQNSSGRIFVTDVGNESGSQGKVVAIDPSTGAQMIIASGGFLATPEGIVAVVPEPSSVILAAGALIALAFCRARFPQCNPARHRKSLAIASISGFPASKSFFRWPTFSS